MNCINSKPISGCRMKLKFTEHLNAARSLKTYEILSFIQKDCSALTHFPIVDYFLDDLHEDTFT